MMRIETTEEIFYDVGVDTHLVDFVLSDGLLKRWGFGLV